MKRMQWNGPDHEAQPNGGRIFSFDSLATRLDMNNENEDHNSLSPSQ